MDGSAEAIGLGAIALFVAWRAIRAGRRGSPFMALRLMLPAALLAVAIFLIVRQQ